ncbi:MAG: hypothetical protein HKL99_10855 [Burkholderiales bacterium]|nr:hypothetical protein [Burkholderiales bacterium]
MEQSGENFLAEICATLEESAGARSGEVRGALLYKLGPGDHFELAHELADLQTETQSNVARFGQSEGRLANLKAVRSVFDGCNQPPLEADDPAETQNLAPAP